MATEAQEDQQSQLDLDLIKRVLCCNALVKYSLIPADWADSSTERGSTAPGTFKMAVRTALPRTLAVFGEKAAELANILARAPDKKSPFALRIFYNSIAEFIQVEHNMLLPPHLHSALSLQSQAALSIWRCVDVERRGIDKLSDNEAAMVQQFHGGAHNVDLFGKLVQQQQANVLAILPVVPRIDVCTANYRHPKWDCAEVAVSKVIVALSQLKTGEDFPARKAMLLVLAGMTCREDLAEKLVESGATLDDLPDDIRPQCQKFFQHFMSQRPDKQSADDTPYDRDEGLDAFDLSLRAMLREHEASADSTPPNGAGGKKCTIM